MKLRRLFVYRCFVDDGEWVWLLNKKKTFYRWNILGHRKIINIIE